MSDQELIGCVETVFNAMAASGGFKTVASAAKANEVMQELRYRLQDRTELQKRFDELQPKVQARE